MLIEILLDRDSYPDLAYLVAILSFIAIGWLAVQSFSSKAFAHFYQKLATSSIIVGSLILLLFFLGVYLLEFSVVCMICLYSFLQIAGVYLFLLSVYSLIFSRRSGVHPVMALLTLLYSAFVLYFGLLGIMLRSL